MEPTDQPTESAFDRVERLKTMMTPDPCDPKAFYFPEVNLAMFEFGKYYVEKDRFFLTEIKIGKDFRDDFDA